MHRLENLLRKGSAYLTKCVCYSASDCLSSVRKHESRQVLSLLLSLSLLCGALFYASYRSDLWHGLLTAPSVIWQGFQPAVILPTLPAVLYHSFPSLISGLSVVLFIGLFQSAGMVARRLALFTSIATLVAFEMVLGYFDWLDIAATAMGVLAGLLCVRYVLGRGTVQASTQLFKRTLSPSAALYQTLNTRQASTPAVAAVLFSSFLAVGSTWSDGYYNGECARYSEQNYCIEYKRSATPVYMSYEKMRASVAMESPRSPDRIGRLYLYGDYVFLNELNEGIHIIDNSEPTSPVNIAFIRIPGNTEIAVRNNYLYADSYIDLVTLDISNPQSITTVGREQSIFPYDAYQNIPQNISFPENNVDRDQGVVVSYRLAGS